MKTQGDRHSKPYGHVACLLGPHFSVNQAACLLGPHFLQLALYDLGLVYSALCPGGGVGRRAAETKNQKPGAQKPGAQKPGALGPGFLGFGLGGAAVNPAPGTEGRINEAEARGPDKQAT